MKVDFAVGRDVVYQLQTFTPSELCAELGVERRHANKLVRTFVEHGMIRDTGCKVGRERIFEHQKPEGEQAARNKQAPPEKVVPLQYGRDIQAQRGQAAGNGKAFRTGSTEVNKLLRELQGQGVEIRERSHKIEYIRDGRVVASSSKTPGASSLKKTRSDLRKAGIAA